MLTCMSGEKLNWWQTRWFVVAMALLADALLRGLEALAGRRGGA